jgi:vancomycin resistance protein YoaR
MASPLHPYLRRSPILIQIAAAVIGGMTLFFGVLIVWSLSYQLVYAGRIFPGVSVAGLDLSGLSPNDAALKLSQTLSYPITGKILFRDGEKLWVAAPAELGMVFDPSASALAAYRLGRGGGLFGALAGQIRARGEGADVSPVVIFDQRVAYTYLQNIAAQVDLPVLEASLRIEGTNVVAQPGQVGRLLNIDATLILLGAQLQSFRDGEVALVMPEMAPTILDVSAQAEIARQIISQPLTLALPNYQPGDPGPWTYEIRVVANMLAVTRVDNGGQAGVNVGLDPAALRLLLNDLKPQVDRFPANARFYFDDANAQLVLIESSKVGRTMDVEASVTAINDALARGEHTVGLVVSEQQPAVSDTATSAELGITQNIITYSTYFYGSSEPRIQNIQAASARFDGVLVSPGETFSMGDALGDVSLDNGFTEALIIYGGRTIKGVGGGVCQVSTTLFRTVFFAGYPVAERIPHAYRVSYYELTASGAVDSNLAGLDATVYFPLVDFKFVNDTPYWLLMETNVDVGARKLTWKLYSTSDGRTVSYDTTGPLNVVHAPDPLFEEDSELKKGQIKQVDWAADGADVTVTRTVMRGGQVYFTDTFKTHYEKWQAICQYGPGTEDPEKAAKRKDLCTPSES